LLAGSANALDVSKCLNLIQAPAGDMRSSGCTRNVSIASMTAMKESIGQDARDGINWNAAGCAPPATLAPAQALNNRSTRTTQ